MNWYKDMEKFDGGYCVIVDKAGSAKVYSVSLYKLVLTGIFLSDSYMGYKFFYNETSAQEWLNQYNGVGYWVITGGSHSGICKWWEFRSLLKEDRCTLDEAHYFDSERDAKEWYEEYKLTPSYRNKTESSDYGSNDVWVVTKGNKTGIYTHDAYKDLIKTCTVDEARRFSDRNEALEWYQVQMPHVEGLPEATSQKESTKTKLTEETNPINALLGITDRADEDETSPDTTAYLEKECDKQEPEAETADVIDLPATDQVKPKTENTPESGPEEMEDVKGTEQTDTTEPPEAVEEQQLHKADVEIPLILETYKGKGQMHPKEAYYAVVKGREVGIFNLGALERFKASIHCYAGSKYKKFRDFEQAKEWYLANINPEAAAQSSPSKPQPPRKKVKSFQNKLLTAYMYGAYCEETSEYGYGNVYLFGTKMDYQSGKDGLTFRKVCDEDEAEGIGEIYAAINAMTYALVNGFDTMIICSKFDYVASLCIGDSEATTEAEQDLLDTFEDVRRDVDILFIPVGSESRYMKLAEQLTKTTLGI